MCGWLHLLCGASMCWRRAFRRCLSRLHRAPSPPLLQSEEALAASSPEAAAARGRALLNLRLTEAEGGLLGRTLLTLVNNKVPVSVLCGREEGGRGGRRWLPPQFPAEHLRCSAPPRPLPLAPSMVQGAGGPPLPLPPHKLSPHDIVRLRPSRGEAGGAPLAEGVVYRVRDTAITVAGEQAPPTSPAPLRSLACMHAVDLLASWPTRPAAVLPPLPKLAFLFVVPTFLLSHTLPSCPPPCLPMPAMPAVEEVPEEGLDVPLRLEKMANEVTYKRLKYALTVRSPLSLQRIPLHH